jgi:hypothetical protein
MQRGIECRERAWATQLSGDLDNGPRGGRGQSARNPSQRRTHALVNHQTDHGSHANSWVKHVNCASVFEIEAVQRGCCAHACDDMLSGQQVKRIQPAEEVGFRRGVDSSPYAVS